MQARISGLVASSAVGTISLILALVVLFKYRGNPEMLKEGTRLFAYFGCSGCHGKGGGGGMGPSVIDDEWKFGSDNATLFTLIKGQNPEQTMPRFGDGITEERVWQLLSFVRSRYTGDKAKINW